jgi:Tlde1 domain
MWTYNQTDGTLLHDGEQVGKGYSGFDEGKNNPEMQDVHDVGPIPAGTYEIGSAHNTDSHGPHVMALKPVEGTNTFGRDGFLIHGDSMEHPGTASHGCIIMPRDVRDKVSASGDTTLEVV